MKIHNLLKGALPLLFTDGMTRRRKWTCTAAFLAIPVLLCGNVSARAAGSNALDRINFGDTGSDSYSESSHSFNSGLSGSPATGIAALGQTFRAPSNGGPGTGSNELEFTMAVSSTLQNYLTIRLWGSDHQPASIWLQGTNFGGYDFMDDNGTGGPPSFPNRFYYSTMAIPISMTQGKTSVTLVLYELDGPWTAAPGRPIYSACTHTDPHFMPDANDPSGTKPQQTGQNTLGTLTSAEALGTTSAPGFLMTNRQNIYSVNNNYFSQILARQIPAGQAGAPPEVIGLDMHTSVAAWAAANPSATPDQWRDACSGGWGPGYSDVPDEMLSVLTATYLLPPFTDQNGNTVNGLSDYLDPTLITRIVSCLDGCTYIQSSDGTFDNSGNKDKNGMNTSGAWQGLTSTPRAAGHPYAGTTSRGTGWSITLEGCDTATIGWTIVQLLNNSTAAPIFKTALTGTSNFDLDGTSMMRAYAYERMLNNQIAFYTVSFDGGVDSQALFDVVGLYSCEVALQKLQALYPYPYSTSTFPNDNYNYPMPYPAVTGPGGVSYAEQMMGLTPLTSSFGGLFSSSYTNYGLSLKGIGEGHGTLSGGYDGRYGTILPWDHNEIAQMAISDPSVNSSTLANMRAQAKATVEGWDHFVSSQEDLVGTTDYYTFAQEDYITYRDPYDANADAGGFVFGTNYLASDPNMGLSDAYATRAAYLETQYGVVPGTGEGGGSQLQYLKNLGSYESTVRSLIGVSPTSLTALPGEPGQANSAWVDPETGATAIYYNGERFYMNANWDSFELASNKYGIPSDVARIHDTLAGIDRTSLVYMPFDSATEQSDGNLTGGINQPWVARFGNWLIMGNNSASSATLKLPAGNGVARDVVSGNRYNMGTNITVPAGRGVAMALSAVTSAQPVASGTYTITCMGSNFVLDDPGASKTSGIQIIQYAADGATDEQWSFTYNGSGYYTVKNVSSGLYLASSGGSSDALEQRTVDGGTDELWQLIASGNGYYLVNESTGTNANNPGNSQTEGTGMILWAIDASVNSVWSLAPVNSAVTQPLPNGTYIMTCETCGLVLDDPGASKISGTQIIQNTANGSQSQNWIFAYNGSGYYTVQNASSGLYLTDPNGSTGNGAALEQQTANGASDQLWALVQNGEGCVLINKAGGNDIDDPGSSNVVGKGMDIWAWGGNINQIWIMSAP